MPIDVSRAIKYNVKVAGKLWKQSDLPSPLDDNDLSPDTAAFATAVAAFQTSLSLTSDGMLGPSTYAALRAMPPSVDSNAAHDFPGEADDGRDDELTPLDDDTPSSVAAPLVGRPNSSNKLILNGKTIALPQEMLDLGISCTNWQDDEEKHFASRPRSGKMIHFVLHESVTTSVEKTNRVLESKRAKNGYLYGIHFNLAPDGHIHQHNDPVLEYLVHGNQLNATAGGIEVTNPYNPKFGGGNVWRETIPGPWWCWKPSDAEKVYCLPTPAQRRTLVPFIRLLTEHCPDLPLAFPTSDLSKSKPRIPGWDKKSNPAKPDAGIVAHRDFASHADGRYLLEYVMANLGG